MSSINQWEKPEHNYSGLYAYTQGPQQDFHLNNKPYVYRSAFKYKNEDIDKPSTVVSDSILNDRIKVKLHSPYSKDGLDILKTARKELDKSQEELYHLRLKQAITGSQDFAKQLENTELGKSAGMPNQFTLDSFNNIHRSGYADANDLPEGFNSFSNTAQFAPPPQTTIKSSHSASSSISGNPQGLNEYGQQFLAKWGLNDAFNNSYGSGSVSQKQVTGDGSLQDTFRILQNSMSNKNVEGRQMSSQLQEAIVSHMFREQGNNLNNIVQNQSDGIHKDMVKNKDGSDRINGGVFSYNGSRLTNKDNDGYLDRLIKWKNGELGNMSRADFEIDHLLYDMKKHRPKYYKKLINLLDNPNATTEDYIKLFDDSIGWVGASFQKTFTPKINKAIENGRNNIAYARREFNKA